MADRYWVGGSGNWDATSTTNWAASSGGASGASAPTSADNVIFDNNSNVGTGAFTVTVTGTSASPSNCQDFSTSSLDGSMTLTMGATAVLNCYGSMTLPATNFAFSTTAGALIVFASTSTGKTITTNGVAFGAMGIQFNGVNGGWTLGSALTTTGQITLISGDFNTSASNYNVSATAFVASGALTRSATLNASTLTVTSATSVTITSTTGLTFNAGTSTINCSNASPTFAGGGLTFYNVSFTGATNGATTITGANTFNNLNQTSRSATGRRLMILGADQTVSGTLTLGAANQSVRRTQVQSDITGIRRTITLNGTLATLADVDFKDIGAAGTVATPWTGTRIGNGLNNNNITFDAAKTVYWNLAAGGNWSATGWATTSGGTPDANNFPLSQDKAIIENTGLNTSATITIETGWWIGELDFSTRSNAMTFANGGQVPSLYKNVTLSSAVTMTGASPWNFLGQGTTQILDTNTATFVPPITIESPSGTLQLAENTTCSATVTLNSGTLNLNNNVLTCTILSSTNSNTRSIAFGTGNITLTGSGATIWNTTTATNFTYTGTPTVNSTYSGSTGTRTINFGGTAGATETNAISINVSAGSDIVALSQHFKNVNFTGFTGSLSNLARTIYGNLTISSGMTLTAGASATTFAATSGTQQITSNGQTLDLPITQNGVGGTVQLQDALTIGSTRTYTLTNGTLDLKNLTLTTGIFSSSNSNTRSIAFGTGNITLTVTNTTVWGMAIATNFTYTGTPTVNVTSNGTSGQTRAIFFGTTSGGTETNSLNFNISNGTDSIGTGGGSTFKNLNFTGFNGTLGNAGRTHYGNLILSSGMTLTSGSLITTFAATSGTQQITTAGLTLDFPLRFNGLGSTFAFQDALTMGSTRTLTLSAGTLLFNSGTTNTVGDIVLSGNSATNTKLGATTPGFQAFLQKVIGGVISASNITVQDSSVTPVDTWYGDPTAVDGGNNTNWEFLAVSAAGHDAFLPQEIRHFKELDRKSKAAEAARVRAAKLMAYKRKLKFKELFAPELISRQEEIEYQKLIEQQYPEEVAQQKAKEAADEAVKQQKAKVEAQKRELKQELKRLQKEEKEAADKVAKLQREKELLIDSVIARQKAMEIQAQLAVIYKLQQEEMEDEAALLLLI